MAKGRAREIACTKKINRTIYLQIPTRAGQRLHHARTVAAQYPYPPRRACAKARHRFARVQMPRAKCLQLRRPVFYLGPCADGGDGISSRNGFKSVRTDGKIDGIDQGNGLERGFGANRILSGCCGL